MVPRAGRVAGGTALGSSSESRTRTEVEAAVFAAARLRHRTEGLFGQLAAAVGRSIQQACDAAAAKAAYRVLASSRVSEGDTLGGHMAAMAERLTLVRSPSASSPTASCCSPSQREPFTEAHRGLRRHVTPMAGADPHSAGERILKLPAFHGVLKDLPLLIEQVLHLRAGRGRGRRATRHAQSFADDLFDRRPLRTDRQRKRLRLELRVAVADRARLRLDLRIRIANRSKLLLEARPATRWRGRGRITDTDRLQGGFNLHRRSLLRRKGCHAQTRHRILSRAG